MEQYISKSALVAEIERRRVSNAKERYFGRLIEDNYFLDFIDTLEVKEVDLEEETDKWYNNEASKEFENILYEDIEKCAKHFFELGQVSNKTQKGEKV